MGAFNTFWIVFILHFNEIQTTSFQKWIRDENINDVVATSSLLLSSPADSKVSCALKCSQEPRCFMIGFLATLGVCGLYPESLTNTSQLASQESTVFYKPFVACEQDGYSYVSSVDVCLKISSNRATFLDARSSCQSEGGDLVSITTDEIYNYLEANLESDKNYWTGATQTPGELDTWFWIDGSPVDPEIWSQGEPNSVLEECMEIRFYISGGLNVIDKGCTTKLYYVCEKRS